ncbi:hypothetical protein NOR51B_2232 [Luminiphilus syltensis NOR5-1B]|uniref:Alpha/beta hydrolase fold-3 domain-containing protein n=1 Tax=Luminiphilus syltensis NOR5-1B TaxID=565045 RepID=B8KVL2_9GAMM|nr:alpha/beta hydrolase fold domain-containing protein [Luminiphilus syltensis]EED36282.1 hypothetical protein NOR51B_2232 [Luminiphilus syltensis NOR5-1B]
MKTSLQSKSISFLLRLLNVKKTVERQSAKPIIRRSKKGFTPKKLHNQYSVNEQIIHNKAVTTFEKKDTVSKKHLLFFHGGAYLFEAAAIHWNFAQKLVDKSNCRLTMIDYPLAPEHDYRATYGMVTDTYTALLTQYPNDEFVFIGDSAGAGLAMGLYQKLVDQQHPQIPTQLILLSPWLDLTLSHPDNKSLESSDHILTLRMLQNAAERYANGGDQEHYWLSPINGRLDDFPPTIIFYGSEELFYNDCQKLERMVSENGNFVFKFYPGMQHDWPMFPIPESTRVVEDIIGFMGD